MREQPKGNEIMTGTYFRRKKLCRVSADGAYEIDYKDVNLLKNYITETGKDRA